MLHDIGCWFSKVSPGDWLQAISTFSGALIAAAIAFSTLVKQEKATRRLVEAQGAETRILIRADFVRSRIIAAEPAITRMVDTVSDANDILISFVSHVRQGRASGHSLGQVHALVPDAWRLSRNIRVQAGKHHHVGDRADEAAMAMQGAARSLLERVAATPSGAPVFEGTVGEAEAAADRVKVAFEALRDEAHAYLSGERHPELVEEAPVDHP